MTNEDPNATRKMRPVQKQPAQPGEQPPAGGKQPQRKGGMTQAQLRIVGAVWLGFTVVAGLGAFALIYWALGGFSAGQTTAEDGGSDLFATAPPQEGLGGGVEIIDAPTETPAPLPVDEPTADDPTALVDINAFALGGQEPHGGFPNSEAMKRAGMRWVKLQAGDLVTDYGPAIDNAHNQGFRIVISVADKANKDRILDPAYQQELFAFLETLAMQGADAIEVWNEPNIDREWPAGQISGASYTTVLQQAYTRIKAANPDTVVISGAPAPTGFFGGACTPNGCDDEPFLREMVAAGALDYMDCVGIHYNEGIISPDQSSGDPRGNSEHYTRYYPTMVSTYREATNNEKPLCFTELGYLAGAENPNLAVESPGFAWAAEVTLQQQAEWLARATEIALESGTVRMIIVFNVGLTTTGDDPQAFYAIVRPDGRCPACDTLGAVMGAQ